MTREGEAAAKQGVGDIGCLVGRTFVERRIKTMCRDMQDAPDVSSLVFKILFCGVVSFKTGDGIIFFMKEIFKMRKLGGVQGRELCVLHIPPEIKGGMTRDSGWLLPVFQI